MGVYKSIFVSDEFEGFEAGTQVQGIDGSVRVFGESAFSSLEQAVAAVNTKAVIARVASGKYDYFVADGNGNFSAAEQVVYVNFNGGSDLSYDNGGYSRSVEMAPAAYTADQQAAVISALNDLNAESGVVFTASAPQGTEFSTVFVGATSSFDDLGTFKGLSETVDTGNAIPNDEAFVNTNNISSVDELIEVIDHEAGHLVGEEHEVTTGTINDFADGEMTILVCKESERTKHSDTDYEYNGVHYTYWAASANAAITLAGGADCNLFIGGVGVATGGYANPSDAIVVNDTTNNNVKSVTLDEEAVLFVGKNSDRKVVDISRFHGTGMVAAYGMVQIDKDAIADDFTGRIGTESTVSSSSSFVSSIEGTASASNLGNSGATVYSFAKGFDVGSGATLGSGEKIVVNIDGEGFTQTGEAQDGGTLRIDSGDVIGTAGETAMEINISNVNSTNASPVTALATLNGNVVGDISISMKDTNVTRTAVFAASSGSRTYTSNITAVADSVKFYQTTGGTASKGGYFDLTVWSAGATTEMILTGNTEFTVKNTTIPFGYGTMYGMYSNNGNESASTSTGFNAVVNGNITLNLEDDNLAYFCGMQGRSQLNGTMTLNVTDTTIARIAAVSGGYQEQVGDFIINAENANFSDYVNAEIANGTRTGDASIVFTGVNSSKNIYCFDNITVNAESSLAVGYNNHLEFGKTFTNSGEVTFNMNGRSTSIKLVDYTGTGSMTLEGYGEVTLLNNTHDLELMVIDNDLYAGIAIAEVNGVKFADLASAYAAAAAGTTEIEKTVKLLVSEIEDLPAIPDGVILQGKAGGTTFTGTINGTIDSARVSDIAFAEGIAFGENVKFTGNVNYGITNATGSTTIADAAVTGSITDNAFGSEALVIGTTTISGTVELTGSAPASYESIFIGTKDRGSVTSVAADVTVTGTLKTADGFMIGSDEVAQAADKADSLHKLTVSGGSAGAWRNNFYEAQSAYILVEEGGQLVGADSSAHGYIDVTGEGSTAVFTGLRFNGETGARAVMTVSDGAAVSGRSAASNFNIGHESSANRYADVTVDGALLSFNTINIDAAATADENGSTLKALNGAAITVTGTLTSYGAVTVDATSLIAAASFDSAGTITIDVSGFDDTMSSVRLIDTDNHFNYAGDDSIILTDSENYKWSVAGGDLYLTKKDAPVVEEATVTHTGLGQDDIQISSQADTTSVTGSAATVNGSVTVQNVADSNLLVGNITADKDVTIDAAAGANDTSIGNVETNQDVNATNNGDGTMQLGGITAGGSVTIENAGNGSMSVTGDTVVAELLEIRNETDNDLSHSGKLAAKDINIYNNDQTKDTTVGEINITQQIEALGDITITNSSEVSSETTAGVVNLGTQEHTAQGGLTIINTENNVINGGGSAAAEDEEAANISVKEDVVIGNEGHINANITTEGDMVITNSSVNTLIGEYTAASLSLDNTGGAAHDVTLTATAGNISVVNAQNAGVGGTIDNAVMNAENGYISISGDGTTTNATINTQELWMGGTSLEITGGTILDDGSTIFLPYANAEDFPETVTPGAVLTVTGDHTVGTNIIADDLDSALYGTVNMNGTQIYNGFRIGADAINVADGADVTLDTVQADFNTLTITGALTTDFTAQDSYTGAGTVTGAGSLHVATDGEWIVNESVRRDFSGFTGAVDMTETGASITLGAPGDGITPAATVAESYFGDGATVTAAAGQAVNLKGEDVTTGIVFEGEGTLNVYENQTLTAANDIALTQVAEGKTLTLQGASHTGDVTLDMDLDPAAVTKLVLDSDDLDFTGTITGDANDVITVTQEADLKSDAALNNFSGTVQVNADLDLEGANDTAAVFTGASSLEANADQTFSADGALDGFTGTLALNANALTLSGANDTAATVTGDDDSVITATADQTFSGDISGFTGTIDADATAAAAVTLSGTVANTLNLKGNAVEITGAAATPTDPITVNAVTSLATLTANDNDIALGTGTFTTVTSTSGDIDLSGYTAGTLGTLASATGDILIASAQNITVSTALDGDLAYTVTAAQTDDTADVTFTGGSLTYADFMTVTAADNYFESPYKLLSADTLTIDDTTFTFMLTVGSESGTIEVDDMTMIGGTLYRLTLDGTAGAGQDLVLAAFNANTNKVYVNNTDAAWLAAVPYEAVMDTFYSDHADDTSRNIGYDAANSIDNAIVYIKADTTGADAGKGWIELTESVNYSISTALGTSGLGGNGVTDMTLRSRSTAEYAAAGNAKVTGDINAGAATTLTLQNISATGSVYGAGTVNISGAKANRFSGSVIAAGGELDITGGTYTTRYIAGGAYNPVDEVAADTGVTITGAADRASFSGSIYGGSIAEGTGIAAVQSGNASVAIDASGDKKVYIAGNIYAAGLARGGATLTVSGDREVTFTGSAANLSFTGRVSGAAQGGTVSDGSSANLNFADFSGKFNGSISDFHSITVSGTSALELGRRQTLTGTTAVNFELTGSSVAGTSMYTVRDKNAWEFAKTISVTADTTISTGTASGTYVLVDNYAAAFDGFTFTVAEVAAAIGETVTVSGNVYTLNYQSDKLTLTYVNNWDSVIIDNPGNQDAQEKEFVIYATDVNGAELTGDTANVQAISAKSGTTVVFNNSNYADQNLLDQNAAGALLYKATDTSTPTPTTSIEWVGNSDTANVTGGLAADSMDISGKTLTVDNANISDLSVTEDANLNLTNGDSTIDTVTMTAGTNLTLDVGSDATVSGTGTGALTISGSNGTVTINNEGTLTAQVTSAGTVVITNTSTNSLYGDFGGAGTELITLDNTGKVADASFTADTVVLNDAVNATTGRLGFYQNITVDAEELILNADLSGWNLAVDVEFPGAIYNFAAGEVSALNFTIDAATSFGTAETVAAVTGADLSATVFTVNGAEIALGDTVTVAGVDYEFNLYNGDAYFFQGSMPVADMSTIVVDSALADVAAFTVVTYEGKDYVVGLNAFATSAEMRGAMTEDTEHLLFKAGNAESYGDLDVDQDVTISTTGEGEALLSRYQTDSKTTPANTVTVAEGSTFRFTVAGALNAQDTIILDGTLIFNTGSSAGDKNMYSKSAITVNKTGSLVYETYAMQNTREPLTVYGSVVIGDPDEDTSAWTGYAIGGYPKIAGNEGGTNGTLIVDGSEGAGTLEVYAPAFSVAAGYAATWRDQGAVGIVTVQNGGSITSNAYMFRNGTNGVITVTDGSSFTIDPDDKYSGIHKLSGYATGNDGAINVLNGSTVDFGNLADFVNFATGTITIDTESLLTATSLTNNGTITVDAADFAGGYKKVIDLDQETELGGEITLINAAEGVVLTRGTDGDVYVVDPSSLGRTFYVSADWSGLEPGDEVTVIPGVTATYGTDAFSTLSTAMGSRTATEGDKLIICSDIVADMSATNEYLQGWEAYVSPADSVVTVEAGNNLTGKNYYIGNDTEDRWDGDTFTPTDKLVLEAGATLGTPAVQDNTAIYVRGTGEIDAKAGVTIGQQPGNIVNLMDYGKVSLTGTTAYLDGFVVYGVDLNENPETLSKAEFNAYGSTIDITGTLNGAHCNQYTVGGIQTAALVGGKNGKGDGTVNLTDTTMTVGNNFIVGFKKNGTLNVDGGSVTVGGTVGVGLDAGSGVVNLTGADLTADTVSIGSNGTINVADGVFTAETVTNTGLFAVSGSSVIDVDTFTSANLAHGVQVADGATLTDSTVGGGRVYVLGDVTLAGDNSFGRLTQYDAGTITVNGDTVLTATLGLGYDDGTITHILTGEGSITAGSVFMQTDNFVVDADINVHGAFYFTTATALVTEDITQTNAGGEVVYINGSTVTLTDGGSITTDAAVFVGNPWSPDPSSVIVSGSDSMIIAPTVQVATDSELMITNGAEVRGTLTNSASVALDVDAVLNGAMTNSATAAMNVTGVSILSTDVAGSKILTGAFAKDASTTLQVEDVDAVLNGSAVQVKGAETAETSDDVWAKLSTSDSSLVVSWGRTEGEVTVALEAFDTKKAELGLEIGQALTSTSAEISSVDDFNNKKNNGTLA